MSLNWVQLSLNSDKKLQRTKIISGPVWDGECWSVVLQPLSTNLYPQLHMAVVASSIAGFEHGAILAKLSENGQEVSLSTTCESPPKPLYKDTGCRLYWGEESRKSGRSL